MDEIFTWLFYFVVVVESFVILFIALTALDILWHKIKGEYYR